MRLSMDKNDPGYQGENYPYATTRVYLDFYPVSKVITADSTDGYVIRLTDPIRPNPWSPGASRMLRLRGIRPPWPSRHDRFYPRTLLDEYLFGHVAIWRPEHS